MSEKIKISFMDKQIKNIIVLEPSTVIYEGVYSIISKSEYDFSLFRVGNLMELETLLIKKSDSIVLINPIFIQDRLADFVKIKKQHLAIYWIGIIYYFFDDSVLKFFDNTFKITDDSSKIMTKIGKLYKRAQENYQDEYLTERETIILKLLIKGLSNKEIAGKLNLSIHTINTHRKNIMDKTGIRSLSGLTLYALNKSIISLD